MKLQAAPPPVFFRTLFTAIRTFEYNIAREGNLKEGVFLYTFPKRIDGIHRNANSILTVFFTQYIHRRSFPVHRLIFLLLVYFMFNLPTYIDACCRSIYAVSISFGRWGNLFGLDHVVAALNGWCPGRVTETSEKASKTGRRRGGGWRMMHHWCGENTDVNRIQVSTFFFFLVFFVSFLLTRI